MTPLPTSAHSIENHHYDNNTAGLMFSPSSLLQDLRLNSVRSLLVLAERSSNPNHAEKLLQEACEMLEEGIREEEEQQQQRQSQPSQSPASSFSFRSMVVQTQHRLGYMLLTRGNLVPAAKVLSQVIRNMEFVAGTTSTDDSGTHLRQLPPPSTRPRAPKPLSCQEYATTLYDVGVIHMMYDRLDEAIDFFRDMAIPFVYIQIEA